MFTIVRRFLSAAALVGLVAPLAVLTGSAAWAVPAAPSGGPSLTVSKTSGLNPDGEQVTVTGRGYDTSKGIYVSFCDISNANATTPPGPCIGGVDMSGESGSSVWISSNPPPYGQGLAQPYEGEGKNGSFTVQLTVKAKDEFTDCLAEGVQCAVVTRNDHTRSSDRSQDVFVPVTFAGQDDTGSGSGSGDGAGDGQTVGTTNNGGTPAAGGGGTSSGGKDGTLPTTGIDFAPFVLGALAVTGAGVAALLRARRLRLEGGNSSR
ncbi:hypothetical protein JCM3263A_28580 [Thermobifida fusca]|jgi:hypothetical protein|uniref:Gram-positive cocci surface proteins LPxTG domain-containing protein n=2 Tax=Thermobifida fusca TaxID=2021 RepID=A0A9P2WPZ9_THEFU|nr:hypothetical protein [Thermobifida fusca]AAZ56420.1 hypothetical protein Tfu_2387 [Thermobifida fusca YX]EOR70504.1 hypothetical protein TM51_12258 [Thermobifida fusca TM51]MDD6791466.1 hypothetical protein [Thermobifida fusca]QOS58891.1 hypothetical protein IM867_00100 [Thermobifida fusca]